MSVLSESNREEIYTRLTEDAAFSELCTGGVHFLVAPAGTSGAYLILTRIPASMTYALANNLVYESDLWLIKAVVPGDEVSDYGASEKAELMLSRADAVLGTNYSVGSGASLLFRREREMPPFAEEVGDVSFHHHGAYFRAITNV